MKINAVEIILFLVAQISFYPYSPLHGLIWGKFHISDVHILLLNVCEFYENLHREGYLMWA
jgi:hypothetical protein